MAAVAGVRSAYATAAAATEDVVTLSGGGDRPAEIINSGANVLYARLDNVAAVAAADETSAVLPGERLSVNLAANGIVRIISTAGTDYGVEVTG